MKHRTARGQASTMGAEVRSRRRRVWRSLLRKRPIDPGDREVAVQLAEESGHQLRLGLGRGAALIGTAATGLWHFFPWTGPDVWLPVAFVVALAIYLVGMAYALRVRRWLRQNT